MKVDKRITVTSGSIKHVITFIRLVFSS